MGSFQSLPAQPVRGVDSEAKLAWDRSGGAHNGRVHMSFTDMTGASDTNIFAIFSDNNGTTWSPRVRVNDDTGSNSQFLPRIALDQTTGNIALCWYDCRNDTGSGGGTTNGTANDDAQFWASFSTDGGSTFAPNFQVSSGTSNAPDAVYPPPIDPNFGYGDFTGLAFHAGNFYPCWADNSNSTGDNPDGALHTMDVYTAKCTITGTGGPPSITSPLTASGNVAVPFNYTITATGSTPITFNAVGIPPGTTFNGTGFSGLPTTIGVFNVTISATNSSGTVFQTVVVTIGPPIPISFTSPNVLNVYVNQPFQLPISATGSIPIFFTVGSLPPGVSFQLGYLLAGAIPTAGTYTVTITATSPAGTLVQVLTINVTAPPPDGDADGDGIPNGLEQTLGTNPFDSNSTPFDNNAPALGSRQFSLSKMDIKKKGGGKDTITLSGALPILTQGYKLDGQKFTSLTVNVIQNVRLLSSGVATGPANPPKGKIKVKVAKPNVHFGTQNAPFSLFMQGDFTSAFAGAGFDGKSDLTFTVYILFNRTVYSQNIKYGGVTHKCSLAQ
jgi:hypothetical protein